MGRGGTGKGWREGIDRKRIERNDGWREGWEEDGEGEGQEKG